MARNPVAFSFPCHRVVDASGALHNYGYGIDIKARILRWKATTRPPNRLITLPEKRRPGTASGE
jgi:hypothetical protein